MAMPTAADKNRRWSILPAQVFSYDFGDVHHFHGDVRLLLRGFLGHHAHAKRTAGGQRLGAGLLELAITIGADALIALLFVLPKLSPAGTAAKAIAAIAARFGQSCAGRLDQLARLVEDAVMTPQITGIMIGD